MAFAAVMSLIRVLENIFQHPCISRHNHISLQKENLEALMEKLNFLQNFLENTSLRRSEVMECLEGKIRDASYEAEDIIESHLVNHLLQRFEDDNYKIFCQSIEKVIEEMDSITKEAKKIKDVDVVVKVDMQSKTSLLPKGSSRPIPDVNISTVGIDDDLLQIKDQLTGQESGVQTISIVGMGGIGKTTLAQKVFHDPLVNRHFDIRAWVTVSQAYSVSKILVDLVYSMIEMGGTAELAEHVYKTLKGRRYLIVLDDVWDTDVWDSVKRYFPTDNIGSRILLTTRLESFATYDNISTIGIDDDLLQIKDQLTGQESGFQTISIVGMGGIGKTTFAHKVFTDPLVDSHFEIRAWVTVSQAYSVSKILLDLLNSMINKMGGSDVKLAEHVYKTLKDRRYLIVLDDIWDTGVWDSVKRCFPTDNIRSRIMLTTRLESVATYANSCEPLHHMRLLCMEVSWSLIHMKLFSEHECCPPELEEIGKKIVENCGGLPLAIVVIGGLLSKVEKTEERWKNVAQDLDLIATTKTENCSNVFSLSYQHLPHRLRSCLLYMGAFPEDYHIPVSKLTKLWVAEGFLKRVETKSWEEVAQGNLEELIERSLISVRKKQHNGKAKTCGIHDLLRDFCLMEAEKDKFLQVVYKHHEPLDAQRRLSSVDDYLLRSQKPISKARSVLLFHRSSLFKDHDLLSSPVLRILDASSKNFNSPETFVNMRFISYPWKHAEEIIPLVSKMWNLQTLIIHEDQHPSLMGSSFHLPKELWNMPQLRHIIYRDGLYLPDYDAGMDGKSKSCCVLENLQTLSIMKSLRCTEEVLKRIPNIKKLGICFRDFDHKYVNWSYYCLNNLVHLQKLETLKFCHIWNSELRIDALPHTLKKLSLYRVDNYWKHLGVIGSLPNLEVFRVDSCGLGDEWEPVEGQFCHLKFMLLKSLYLVHWRADSTHFPFLEHLIIDDCADLKEIPCSIGDIPTLEKIELVDIGLSVFNSAKKLVEDQRRLGNDELEVYVRNTSKWSNENKKVPDGKL